MEMGKKVEGCGKRKNYEEEWRIRFKGEYLKYVLMKWERKMKI